MQIYCLKFLNCFSYKQKVTRKSKQFTKEFKKECRALLKLLDLTKQ